MSKPLNPAIVEYAYVKSVSIQLNCPSEIANPVYVHIISISYELKDSSKNLLDVEVVSHATSSTAQMQSVADAMASINAALPGWIASDKLNLSGYGV